jgi:hypothetical protein
MRRPWWIPPGMATPGQALPNTGGVSHRIRSTPIERYRPLIRVPIHGEGTGRAVVNAQGAATVTVNPQGLGTKWYPVKADISTTSGVNDASTCALFIGAQSVATQIGGTSYAGGGDTFGLAGHILAPGDLLIAVWAGGNPGDIATLRITGDQVVMVA